MTPHIKYLWYVLRHKWFVALSGIALHVPLWRLLWHDWTKFLPREWFPYTQYFYGDWRSTGMDRYTKAPSDIEEPFEVAWNHHQKKNDHHWQYWVRLGDDGTVLVLPMSDIARREMLADWRGAGRALGTPDTRAWYFENGSKMQLHPETRAWVEAQLKI